MFESVVRASGRRISWFHGTMFIAVVPLSVSYLLFTLSQMAAVLFGRLEQNRPPFQHLAEQLSGLGRVPCSADPPTSPLRSPYAPDLGGAG